MAEVETIRFAADAPLHVEIKPIDVTLRLDFTGIQTALTNAIAAAVVAKSPPLDVSAIAAAVVARLQPQLDAIATKETTIMASVEDLEAAATGLSDIVENTVIPLLNQLKAAATPPNQAAIDAALASLNQANADVSAAVTADTPPTP